MRLVAVVAVALATTATLAHAAGEPFATADARLGSLHVTSAVYVSPRKVELLGVWNDPKAGCTVNRRLTVKGEVDVIPFGGTPRRPFVRTRTFLDANCAEGGPNVGFTVTARQLRLACPNGTWRPARYNFLTRTTEPSRKLTTTASVNWAKTARC